MKRPSRPRNSKLRRTNSSCDAAGLHTFTRAPFRAPHHGASSVSLVGGGVTLSDTPAEIRTVAPDYGQHTDEILHRIGRGFAKDAPA